MGGLAFILTHSESATLAEIMEYHRGYATGAMHWASQQKYTGYQPENAIRIGSYVLVLFPGTSVLIILLTFSFALCGRHWIEINLSYSHIIVRLLMHVIAERITMKARLQDGGIFSTPAR
jgi:hypothetical protein